MKRSNKIGMFLFGIFVLFLLFIIVQKKIGPKSDVLSYTKELCGMSGGIYQDNLCACGNIFPQYNEKTGRCENINGESPKNLQEYHSLINRYHFAATCVKDGYDIYVVPGKALTFCYDAQIANPKVNTENAIRNVDVVDMLNAKMRDVARITYIPTEDLEIWDTDIASWCEECKENSQQKGTLEKKLSALGFLSNDSDTSVQPYYTIFSKKDSKKIEGIFIPYIDEHHHLYIDHCKDESFCNTIAEHSMTDSLLLENI